MRINIANRQASPTGYATLIAAFVNTAALEAGKDSISSPSGLKTWLVDHRLAQDSDHLSLEDVARIIELREGLREMIGLNAGGVVPGSAAEGVNRVARSALLRVSVSISGEIRLEPAPGTAIEKAAAAILGAIYCASSDGSWSRLKLCKNPRCRWVFYDRSKNRSGSWCTMAICGNRAKARTFRARRRLGQQQV